MSDNEKYDMIKYDDLNGDVPIDQLISTDALRFVIKANKN
jgi:hypothetical protein